MNVALSRARHNMFIIGDQKFFLESGRKWKKSRDDRRTINTRDLSSNPNIFLTILSKYYSTNQWISKYKSPKTMKQIGLKKINESDPFVTLLKIILEHKQKTKKNCTSTIIGNYLTVLEPNWKEKLGFKSVSKLLDSARERELIIIADALYGNKIIKLTEKGRNYLNQENKVKFEGRKNQ